MYGGGGHNFLCQLLINVLNAQQGYNFKEILAYDSVCSVENLVELLKRWNCDICETGKNRGGPTKWYPLLQFVKL